MKKIPAILDCVAETRGVQIAGLSLLDRLIVTAHRAGCAPIYLIAKTTPSLPRARALGIKITLASAIPEFDEPALLISGAALVETVDLQRVIEERGQLFSADARLPVGMTTGEPVVLLLAIAGKLDLFLWMAGIGVHLFWIIALRSQWRDTGRAPAISEESA